MSGFRGKEIVDAHVRKYCVFFFFTSSNPIDKIVTEASRLTSDEYRTGCKVVNLKEAGIVTLLKSLFTK